MNEQSYSLKTDRPLAVAGQWLKHMILFLIFSTISTVQAQTQNACEVELRLANQQYRFGKFDSAYYFIRLCLNKKEAITQDSVEAYKLLGKIHIAKDSTDKAREAFKIALKLNDCQITLDANQEPPVVIKIFNKVKQQTCGKSKKWLWIGGGLIAAGTTTIIICPWCGDGPTQDGFVQPPSRPPGK